MHDSLEYLTPETEESSDNEEETFRGQDSKTQELETGFAERYARVGTDRFETVQEAGRRREEPIPIVGSGLEIDKLPTGLLVTTPFLASWSVPMIYPATGTYTIGHEKSEPGYLERIPENGLSCSSSSFIFLIVSCRRGILFLQT